MQDNKAKIEIALKKACSSLNKITKQVGENKKGNCFAVIQQNLAVIGLLKSINLLMLEHHLNEATEEGKIFTAKGKAKADKLKQDIIKIVKTAQTK